MTAIDTGQFLSDRTVQVVAPAWPQAIVLTAGGPAEHSLGEGWLRAVERLHEWATNPAALDRDEIEPPSRGIIQAAEWLLHLFRSQGISEGFFPVPDSRGGVCFERESGALFEEYELAKSGAITYRRYVDGQLTWKRLLGRIPVPTSSEPD